MQRIQIKFARGGGGYPRLENMDPVARFQLMFLVTRRQAAHLQSGDNNDTVRI